MQFWQAGLFSSVYWITVAQVAWSQSIIVPDETLGNERSSVIQSFEGLPIELITDGTRRGQNLFHSFEQFNVNENRGAYFSIPDAAVRNVLARVTGGKPSEILGVLGTAQLLDSRRVKSNANLFLINPSGIIFGPNAALDVDRSFTATTANALQIGDQAFFSATTPETTVPLLQVNPSAFLFNQLGRGEITVRSNNSVSPQDSTSALRVADGQTLTLLGGNVSISGKLLLAREGNIVIGAVRGRGTIKLDPSGSLDFPADTERGDIFVRDQANVSVSGQGNINITAHKSAFLN